MLRLTPGEVVAQPRAAPAFHVVRDQVETGHDDQDYRSGEQQAEAQADRHRRQEGRLAGGEEDQRRDAQEGGYTGQEIRILYSVVTFSEISRFKEMVKKIDPQAFVVVTETLEVMGHGIGNQPHW